MATRDEVTTPAEGTTTLLDPGRDPEMEIARRDAPFDPAGMVALAGLFVIAAAVARWTRQRGRLRTARVLLAVAGALAGLSVAELVLRATADDWRLHVKVRDSCYHDNPRGYFQQSRFHDQQDISAWCTDRLSDTWAECDAPTAEANAGRTRVMAVGDSFTDGVGVFRRDTWPASLGRDLGADVAVVNCGRASSATGHVARRLLSHEARHDPDIVVYAFVLNDVSPPQTADVAPGVDIGFQLTNRDLYSEHVDGHAVWGPLSRWFAVVRLSRERLATRSIGAETLRMYQDTYAEPLRPELVAALDLTATMAELAQDRGARFLVVVWPLLESLADYPFRDAHRVVVEGLEARGVEVLDLLPGFEGRDETALWVHPTDHHPNEIAQREAASLIAAELRRLDWGVAPAP